MTSQNPKGVSQVLSRLLKRSLDLTKQVTNDLGRNNFNGVKEMKE